MSFYALDLRVEAHIGTHVFRDSMENDFPPTHKKGVFGMQSAKFSYANSVRRTQTDGSTAIPTYMILAGGLCRLNDARI